MSGNGTSYCLYMVSPNDTSSLVEVCLPRSIISSITTQTQNYSDEIFSSQIASSYNMDGVWLLFTGYLVFFMQAGFALLESGAVKSPNVQHVLFKNLMDTCFAAVAWFLFGYCIAFGIDDDTNGFIGTRNVALSGTPNAKEYKDWFFQFAFATTTGTIVSGAVAERCTITAYCTYTTILTIWVYPAVVHWFWDNRGWLSPFNSVNDINSNDYNSDHIFSGGIIDFAGSGVVHMVGGISGLIGTLFLGPRFGRFDKIVRQSTDNRQSGQYDAWKERELQHTFGNSVPAQYIGLMFLWFGWYGFNCGSTLEADGKMELASKIAVNVTVGAACGAVGCMVLSRKIEGYWSVPRMINGILGGLVSVTGGCAVINPTDAMIIALLSTIVYYSSSMFIEKLKIDDPLDAFAVHGCCGMWGMIAIGLFADESSVKFAGYNDILVNASVGYRFSLQLFGVFIIIAWVLANVIPLFWILKKMNMLRVSLLLEESGLDWAEHGATADVRRLQTENSINYNYNSNNDDNNENDENNENNGNNNDNDENNNNIKSDNTSNNENENELKKEFEKMNSMSDSGNIDIKMKQRMGMTNAQNGQALSVPDKKTIVAAETTAYAMPLM